MGPLLAAVAACILFSILGTVFVGGNLGYWYAGLEKPSFLVPLPVFYLVGAVYYVLFAFVLYRVLVHVEDRGAKAICLSLVLLVMLLNEVWNYAFFGLRSTLLGFLGMALFLAPLTALLVALSQHERVSAWALAPYYVWVIYDLAWTFALWRLNGA